MIQCVPLSKFWPQSKDSRIWREYTDVYLGSFGSFLLADTTKTNTEFSNIMSRSHTILSFLSCYSDLIFLTFFMLNRPHILKYFDDLNTVMLSMHLFYNMPNCRFYCPPISNHFTFSFPFIHFPPLLFGYSQTIFWVMCKKRWIQV